MMQNDLKPKIDFLNNAINDTQELIRFIDTKLTVAITIVGALLAVLLSTVEKVITYNNYYSDWFWIFLSVLIVLLIACFIIIIKIIVPTSNPNDNIDFGNVSIPTLKFYLAKNKYNSKLFCFYYSSKHSLEESLETYLTILDSADEQSMINILACEKFKLNYIRNIKSDRLRWLTYLFILTTISFIVYYLFFSIETQHIIKLITSQASNTRNTNSLSEVQEFGLIWQ